MSPAWTCGKRSAWGPSWLDAYRSTEIPTSALWSRSLMSSTPQ